MAKLFYFLRNWLKILFLNKLMGWSFLILIGLMAIFTIRSCTKRPVKKALYQIGQDVRWYGVNLMGKERNMTAFSNELLRTIAKDEDLKVKTLTYSPPELLKQLRDGTLDAILSALEPNFSNQTALAFSEPYFLIGPVLIVPKQSNIHNTDELNHKVIGVQTNSSTILELEKNSTIQIRLYDNILDALSDLESSRIDGVLFPVIPSIIYTSTFYPDRFTIATSPLTNEGFRLVTLNNEEGLHLISHFNKGLQDLKENGTYDLLLEKWGLIKSDNSSS